MPHMTGNRENDGKSYVSLRSQQTSDLVAADEPSRDSEPHASRSTMVPMPPQEPRSVAEQIKHPLAHQVETFMGVVIVVNVLEVGMQLQWSPSDYPVLTTVYFYADCFFAALYILEVLFGVSTERCYYFMGGWNLANLTLTILAVASIAADVTGSGDLSGTEILRLIRFVRIIRVVRVLRSIPDLVMVVEGLIKSFRSLSWVLMLLAALMYIFALFFTMEIGSAEMYGDDFGGVNYFGDMAHSMMTLMDIAMLAEWGTIVRPVAKYQPILLPFFIAFALTSSFGMLNVMIGVIVDNTQEAKRDIENQKKHTQLEGASRVWQLRIHERGLKTSDIAQVTDPQEQLRLEGERHTVIKEIMQEILDDSTSVQFPHGLTPDDVISLLDFDGSGNLTHEEFRTGLQRLILGDEFQLTCLSLTVMGKMRNEHNEAQQKIQGQLAEVLKRLDRIERGQGELQRSAETGST